MVARLFNWAAACSAVALCLAVAAWFAAAGLDPRRQSVAVAGGFLGLSAHGADLTRRQVDLFSDPVYGPYGGSIIGIAGDPNGPVKKWFDAPGIYYRCFRWRDGRVLWTLSVSLLYPLGLSLVLPAAWLTRRASRRPRGSRGFDVAVG